MKSHNTRKIHGLLDSMRDIHYRMMRDDATLKTLHSNLRELLNHGCSTGDHILDIALRHGLPGKTDKLETHLHIIDAQLQASAGQFVLTELISYDHRDHSQPKIHQATVGVLTTDFPTMHYINEEGKFSGVVIPTKSPPRILLSDDFLNELQTSDKTFWVLLNGSLRYSFELAIGYHAVWNFLSPERISLSETPETRQARMKRIARQLHDLMLTHGVRIEGHPKLQNFIHDASRE